MPAVRGHGQGSTGVSDCSSRWLPQAVFALDLALGQTSYARQRAAAIGHCDCNHDFIGPRSVVDSDFHAIEVTSDESRIFVAEWDIEYDSQSTALLRGLYEGSTFTKNFPYRRAQFGVENRRRVLNLAIFANGSSLTVAFDAGCGSTQGRDRAKREQLSQLLADRHQFGQVFNVLSRTGILNHGDGGGASSRRIDSQSHLGTGFFDERCNLADSGFHYFGHQRNPSSPLISEALRPPTRA